MKVLAKHTHKVEVNLTDNFLTDGILMRIWILAVVMVIRIMAFMHKMVRYTRKDMAKTALAASVLANYFMVERNNIFPTMVL